MTRARIRLNSLEIELEKERAELEAAWKERAVIEREEAEKEARETTDTWLRKDEIAKARIAKVGSGNE